MGDGDLDEQTQKVKFLGNLELKMYLLLLKYFMMLGTSLNLSYGSTHSF